MDERMQKLNFTQAYDVRGRYSVAELIPKSKPRTGIYLLEFSDGLCYIGQAVDVARRFSDHRKKYDDIVHLYFKPTKKSQLNVDEHVAIFAAPSCGIVLTNRVDVSTVVGPTDLDHVICEAEQVEWLENPSKHQNAATRVLDESLRMSHRKQYQSFMRRQDRERLLGILRHYIRNTVPAFRKTEVSFWSLSCMPSTLASTSPRLSCCSLNTMETLVIGHYKGDPNDLSAFVILSPAILLEPCDSDDEIDAMVDTFAHCYPGAWFEESGYKAAGPDQMRISINGLDQIEAVLHDEAVLRACRYLNLELMRKGATVQWRGHCLDLADHIVCD